MENCAEALLFEYSGTGLLYLADSYISMYHLCVNVFEWPWQIGNSSHNFVLTTRFTRTMVHYAFLQPLFLWEVFRALNNTVIQTHVNVDGQSRSRLACSCFHSLICIGEMSRKKMFIAGLGNRSRADILGMWPVKSYKTPGSEEPSTQFNALLLPSRNFEYCLNKALHIFIISWDPRIL